MPSGTRVGVVTHFYSNVNAAIIDVQAGEIKVGDVLHFTGHTTDLRVRVGRIELDHESISVAHVGQVVGIQVSDRVREHDQVHKL
jgi:translation elongation factor EF-1alpha